MDLKSISLFSSLSQKMNWLTERQKVLAQNIANANTPGYVPRDLKKISFKAQLDQTNSSTSLSMLVTDSRHLTGSGSTSGNNLNVEVQDAKFSMDSPDGNAVKLEDELIKMSDTQMQFGMATSLYRKHVSMLKTALGRTR